MSAKPKAKKLRTVTGRGVKPTPSIGIITQRDRILESMEVCIQDAVQAAQDAGMTLGQWQDTVGEIANMLHTSCHWSNAAAWQGKKS